MRSCKSQARSWALVERCSIGDGQGDLDQRMALELCDLFAAARAFFQLNGMDGNPVYIQREIQKYQQFLKWHAENLPDKDDSITQEIQALDEMLQPDETWPAPFPQSNSTLVGTPEDRASGKVIDLPVYRYEDAEGRPHVISKWKLSTSELAEVMRTGHVWLHAWGVTHPPIAVSGANPFKE